MINWRYFYKQGDQITSSDQHPSVPENFPKIAIASMSKGVLQSKITKAIKFFAENDILVRAPVFYDTQGDEILGQSQDYKLESRDFYLFGLSIPQATDIVFSCIEDGFDLVPSTGGLGLCQHALHILNRAFENMDKLDDLKKIRILGFSNSSTSLVLSDLVHFIHTPAGVSIPEQISRDQGVQALSVIKKQVQQTQRQTRQITPGHIPQEMVYFPINITTVFDIFSKSFVKIKVPEQDWCLLLETISWGAVNDTESTLEPVRTFLRDLQERGRLPKAVEFGDFTIPSLHAVYEDGRLLLLSEVKHRFGDKRLVYSELKKYIAKSLKKNEEELTESEADEYIQRQLNQLPVKYHRILKSICDEFQIPILSGQERSGHGYHNKIQPSFSRCTLLEEANGSITVTSNTDPIKDRISKADLLITQQLMAKQVFPAIQDHFCQQTSDQTYQIALSPVNSIPQIHQECENILVFHPANKELRDLESDSKQTRCIALPSGGSYSVAIFHVLEPLLLQGRLGPNPTTPDHLTSQVSDKIIFAIVNYQEKEIENPGQKVDELKNALRKFCEFNEVKLPIFVATEIMPKSFSPKRKEGVIKKIDAVLNYEMELEAPQGSRVQADLSRGK